MDNPVIAYVGFGSNLGDRHAAWAQVLDVLSRTDGVRILRTASPVETDPIGPIVDQPRYLNSVIMLETTLEPLILLDTLLGIEHQMGRVRRERWGPRTVDLDILLYGDRTIDLPRLKVPHPEMANRPFIANALAELNYSGAPKA